MKSTFFRARAALLVFLLCFGTASTASASWRRSPDLVISSPLSESSSSVQPGGTLTARISFKNIGNAPQAIQELGITSLPPGGTQDNGPWKTFTPELGATSVQPGATLSLKASGTFTSSNPTGVWQLYATYLDGSGVWHDSPSLSFTVAPGSPGTSTGTAGGSASGGATSGGSSSGGASSGGGGGGSGAQSWVWVFQSWPQSLAAIAANSASFTHVSPTLYSINYAYTGGVPQFAFGDVDSFGGLTSTQICQQVHAAGHKCVPLVFGGADNSGTDQGIQNILNDTAGSQTSFINALVSEGKAKGYDGWNLDWEVGSGTRYPAYGQALISFLGALRQQLHQNGMLLSIDIINNMMKQSDCSGGVGLIDLTQIGGVVDSVIDEDYQPALWTGSGAAPTSCPSSLPNPMLCQEDVVADLELLCTYVRPASVVNVGLLSPSQNALAGSAFAAIHDFGFNAVSVWPNDNPFLDSQGFVPSGSNWFEELKQVLASF